MKGKPDHTLDRKTRYTYTYRLINPSSNKCILGSVVKYCDSVTSYTNYYKALGGLKDANVTTPCTLIPSLCNGLVVGIHVYM